MPVDVDPVVIVGCYGEALGLVGHMDLVVPVMDEKLQGNNINPCIQERPRAPVVVSLDKEDFPIEPRYEVKELFPST